MLDAGIDFSYHLVMDSFEYLQTRKTDSLVPKTKALEIAKDVYKNFGSAKHGVSLVALGAAHDNPGRALLNTDAVVSLINLNILGAANKRLPLGYSLTTSGIVAVNMIEAELSEYGIEAYLVEPFHGTDILTAIHKARLSNE